MVRRARRHEILVTLALGFTVGTIYGCVRADDRDGIDKLGKGGRPEQGFFGGGGGGGGGGFSPGNQNAGSGTSTYKPKRYDQNDEQPGSGMAPAAGATKQYFTIKAGTGTGAWNDEASALHLTVGQTLIIMNQDSVPHQLHTNGVPCAHSEPFGPGESFECPLASEFDPKKDGPLYDHPNGSDAAFWLFVTKAPAAPTTPTPPTDSGPAAGAGGSEAGFAAVAPIVEKSCGGGNCHGAGSDNAVFVGDAAAMRALKTQILSRIGSDDPDRRMPPNTSGRILSDAEGQMLADWLQGSAGQ